jgi:hypothetical protein
MTNVFRIGRLGWRLLLALGTLPSVAVAQAADPLRILNSPVGENTTVRFFFNPGEAYHWPLVFHVVQSGDQRLNTMPKLREGIIAYITPLEMQHLLQRLEALQLSWNDTRKIEPLGSGFHPPIVYAMEITVLASRGTAKAEFAPPLICEDLAPLESALTSPRARWEFQFFRTTYDCKIPGYDPDAFTFRDQKSVW